jgi:hypothetical protein
VFSIYNQLETTEEKEKTFEDVMAENLFGSGVGVGVGEGKNDDGGEEDGASALLTKDWALNVERIDGDTCIPDIKKV